MIGAGASGGFTGGLVAGGGDLKTALYGAITGAAFGAVGHYFGEAKWYVKGFAHGLVGGASSRLQGGSFKSGFLAGGVSGALAGQINDWFKGEGAAAVFRRVVASAVVGGTAARLGGGKFANGALTAAFGRLFNEGLHRARRGRILVTIGYTNLPGITNSYHTLLYGTDMETGRQFAIRGGQRWWSVDRCCQLFAKAGYYDNRFPDAPATVHTVQVAGVVDMSFEEFSAHLTATADAINAANLEYYLVRQNSNATTGSVLRSLGLSIPWNSRYAPGWNDTIP